MEDHWYHGGSAPQTGISQEQAEEIALQRVPGAQAEQIRLNLEMDDGRMVYEGKIIHQEQGTILKSTLTQGRSSAGKRNRFSTEPG